ncbi:GMC family oxidoreductase [Acetobacter orleanensis]|uniref:Gluconate dehydrogenase n=1 Tax=Acetobacter orleanensis TaxID=104099 RepID=A0A4Y3TJY7_9PROT|nr:GMC family oxidoreductase [Acetobacter orleanensis]KXV67054.1 GMC family oxidoreductase [Acetobacter orleanensis]PCD79672.1 GMC family oxidoreductase [Acetobacter orleanensis]GAN68784.1 gluconate 2-dehydrogenase alpha chain/solbitol dehydrogenase large subunit [Acetobacter orleanensis JCM 7639]GBR28121.1 gluconate 2-dehydrogenase [Acetobacter orleanensis NRIC 0473]GEB82242.1 gluconate dehydrogenase [Acetobacter orleanensis]
MAEKTLPPVDVVVVGSGWAGSIMAKELCEAGLSVVMLERGGRRSTARDGAYPSSLDELEGAVRYKLFQNPAQTTVTVRNRIDQEAVPYRRLAAFLPGAGVGGAGLHWTGVHFRAPPQDLRLRSRITERYGRNFIPEGMNLQDYGVTYEELEPFFDRAEKVFGTSGEAYTIKGKKTGTGNVFAPDRSDNFPLPALRDVYTAHLFRHAAAEAGYHPYAMPAANASQPYTNPYGTQMGPCNFCGYCSDYACYMYAKASPNVNIMPALRRHENFTLRSNAHVLKVLLDSTGKKATGVVYQDAEGNHITQPAGLVILAAFQFHNVHLMLLSGIGKAYDPVANTGTVGRNFTYQNITNSTVWMPPTRSTDQFIGSAGGVAIDDFNSDNFDHGPLGFIGGSPLWVNQAGVKPIAGAKANIPGVPRWGSAWKKAAVETYRHSFTINAQGSNMAYRDVYLDLDPTWRTSYGQPMLRMTFDWKENDIRMNRYVIGQLANVVKALGAQDAHYGMREPGKPFDVREYQTTHLCGGAVMGEDPKTSALNRYLQSWDVSNVFVVGANAFPQGMGYNPTGLVAALAYWSAHHIRTQWLKGNGGPLVAL